MNWRDLHLDHFQNTRVLVTGAAGFIGSHLVQALVQLGADVVAFDDLSGGSWANLAGFNHNVNQITASILDENAIAHAIDGCRYVFHQAALGSVPRSIREPMLYQQVNVIGTAKVLHAAAHAKVHRLIFAGSSSAYGDPPDTQIKHEKLPPLPRSPYAATKLAGEHLCRAWAHSYHLDTAVTRYFNIFGPRQNANSAYAAVIAAFAKSLLAGQPPVIFGDGNQTRDFTFVHNAVHANLLAARASTPLMGEVFNIACGRRVSVNDLFAQMAQQLNQPNLRPDYQPARAGDVRDSLADITKARTILGYEPLVDFSTGLKATVDWYRDNLND